MKILPLVTPLVVGVLGAVFAGCDDDDGKQACEAYAQKCPGGAGSPVQGAAGGAGQAGAGGSDGGAVVLTCNSSELNAASNIATVEDCIQGAADCATATACLASLKR